MTIKKKIAISIIIVLIFTALIIYFVIYPTIKDIKKISSTIYDERVDLEKKYLRGQLLKKTIEEFESAKPKQEKLASIFIVEGNELEFITALEKIASAYNVEQSLQLKPVQNKNSFYYSLPLDIKIKGNFINILKYLKELEKSNYYFNISAVDLNNDNKTDIISADLSGKVYALSSQKE